MRMRPGGQLAWARAGSGAARLLLLCVASGAMWGRASASGGAIFTGHIEAACVATMMVKMLFFAMAWEFLTGRIEDKLDSNPAHREMLIKVYKELMILGFIGFMMIMTKEQGYTLSPATMLCFEFCDLMVTICVLLYTACTAISCFYNHVTRRNWDRISMTSVHNVCLDIEEHLETIKVSAWARLKHSTSSEWRAQADFKLVELLFKTKFHLEKNFDYMMYAKSVLEKNVVDLANISTYHWAAICAISMSIYFAGPGEFDPEEFMEAFKFELPGGTSNSSSTGDDAGGRRRLGGTAQDQCTEPVLPCGLNASALQYAVDSLFMLTINATNATSPYNETCSLCSDSTPQTSQDNSEKTRQAILMYGMIGWVLITTQGVINWWLTHKMNLILKYHGANHVSTMPNLLRHLDEHFSRRDDGDERQENLLDVGQGGEDDEGEAQENEHHMMVFNHVNKTANDVLSWWMFRFLMFTTKMIQLTMCFYMGFYICHMNLRLQLVNWTYLEALGFEDAKYVEGGSMTPRNGVHIWLIFPILWIVFWQLPMFTKDISLLVGVLHLDEDAVNAVIQHMEVVKSIRKRIKERLDKTKILKGKKKLKKGLKELELIEKGEFKILSTLKHQDEADVGHETRLTRREIQALLDQYKTETADRELAVFMNRDAFREFEKEADCDKQTAQTSKTMVIAERPDEDSITLRELVTFLVRAIADACNIADEHGVPTTEIAQIRDSVIQLSTVSVGDFEEARMLARTKSLFRAVDSDKSGKVTRSELHRAFRKYRVPVSNADMDIILRVIDPDQSGYMTMEEWLDFMLATDDNLEQASLNASAAESKLNAEAGGDGIVSSYIKYGEEAIDAIPGGSYVTKTIKDPRGTVVNVANGTLQVVTDPMGALKDDLLPMMGLPEARKPLKGHWDPEGIHAGDQRSRTMQHELDEKDIALAQNTSVDMTNAMDNPIAGTSFEDESSDPRVSDR